MHSGLSHAAATEDDDDDDGGGGGGGGDGAEAETDRLLAHGGGGPVPAPVPAVPPTLWTGGRHAIPLFYFLLGFLTNFPRVALRDFCMKELRVDPATQQLILGVVMLLPWNFKVLYGFVSDAFPVCGMHRKPYMLMGVALCAASWCSLGVSALVVERGNYAEALLLNATAMAPLNSTTMTTVGGDANDRPSVGVTCALLFLSTFGMIFTDVCTDTLVVERMKAEERGAHVGDMQTQCWQLRLLGQLAGLLFGGFAVSVLDWFRGTVFVINGIMPLLFLPSLLMLRDVRPGMDVGATTTTTANEQRTLGGGEGGKGGMDPTINEQQKYDEYAAASEIGFVGIRKKLEAVWEVMAEPYLWKPMLFVFVNASTPGSADAFVNFMLLPISQKGLGITLGEYTWLLAIGQVASIFGAWLYQHYFSTFPWRALFYSVMLLSVPLALTQFVVIFRWHEAWGLDAFAFLFGSEVVTDVVGFLLQMPILIMSASLSPAHIEGTVYALQVSCNNIGLSVGGQIGAVLTEAFGVTETDMSHLWQLTAVCISVGILPIFLVPCLPQSAQQRMMGEKSPVARMVMFVVLVGSLVVSTISSIVEIAEWGAKGTGDDVHVLPPSHVAVNGSNRSAIYPTAGGAGP